MVTNKHYYLFTIVNFLIFTAFLSVIYNYYTKSYYDAEIYSVTSEFKGEHVLSTKVKYNPYVVINLNNKQFQKLPLKTKELQFYKKNQKLKVYISNGFATPMPTKLSIFLSLLILFLSLYYQNKFFIQIKK